LANGWITWAHFGELHGKLEIDGFDTNPYKLAPMKTISETAFFIAIPCNSSPKQPKVTSR
jgi:hypothetical protein